MFVVAADSLAFAAQASASGAADSLAFAAQASASGEGGSSLQAGVGVRRRPNDSSLRRLEKFNETPIDERGLGFHIILLTGRSEIQHNAT
ncbi:hypothetical protein GUJ93_ZPchr0006g45915 [Zizania palustris]|uniref:Uncharacterized protein n=1 Tax=Zizania palustris TaxID=103762 RepID=A0A8J5VPS8_ZIZPA|nr:hypothetical protein GUJ93_ZPchr0006g45915 [Zizania palustris]